MMTTEERLLTVREAAEIARVSVGTVREWIRHGQLKAQRTKGGHYRIARNDLMSGGEG
jgi:excisionase family DNA binding protein